MDEKTIDSWFATLVGGLVSKPDEIEIKKTDDEQGILYTVTVAKDDVGKVIGKGGSNASALRALIRAVAFLHLDKRASVKIDAPSLY